MIETSSLNARIHEDKIQFSDTATITVMGVSVPVIVQATGTFVKSGSGFEFEPESIYVGGCPMQRMLFIRGWILRKLLFTVTRAGRRRDRLVQARRRLDRRLKAAAQGAVGRGSSLRVEEPQEHRGRLLPDPGVAGACARARLARAGDLRGGRG